MSKRNVLADDVIDAVIALIDDLGETDIELIAKKNNIEIKVDIKAGYIEERGSDEL